MSITTIEGGIMGLKRSSESTVTGVANFGGSMDHAAQAQVFLKQSDEEFARNDVLQGSEKLWSATCQAIMAIAEQRGWSYGKSKHRSVVVDRLADESEESWLKSGYGIAEKFHANFYNDFMEDYAVERDRPVVHRLVERLLSLNGSSV